MRNFKLVSVEQQNPFYDERTCNNGGGYDQPLLHFSDGEYKLDISDENVGDFGDRYSIILAREKDGEVLAEYYLDETQEDEYYREYSSFRREPPLHRRVLEFARTRRYASKFEDEVDY